MSGKTQDQLFNPMIHGSLHGALSGGANSDQAAFGRTVVASGTLTTVVSTTLINSDSIVMMTNESNTRQTSGAISGQMEVSSIVSGVSFNISWANEFNTRAADTTVMWALIRTSQS
jgi:hypothetical protein